MNIHRAISDIADIRAQLDRTETYRGFRSTAVGVSVLVLIVGALVEKAWVSQPTIEFSRYLTVWISVAAICALLAAFEMVIRGRISGNRLVWKLHRSLITQIAPSLVVGSFLTLLIGSHAMEQSSPGSDLMWSLPGIWSMLYGLGLLASNRQLPAQAILVGVYFLCSGAVVLAYGWSTRELAGWQMIATFGIGHTLLAWVLFWNLEKKRAPVKS